MRRKNISIYKRGDSNSPENLDMITQFDSSCASRYARAVGHLHRILFANDASISRSDEISSNYLFDAMNLTQDEMSHNSPWTNRTLIELISGAISTISSISCMRDDPTKHLDGLIKQCDEITEQVRTVCSTNRTSQLLLLLVAQAIELGLNEQSDASLDISAEDLFSAALNLSR